MEKKILRGLKSLYLCFFIALFLFTGALIYSFYEFETSPEGRCIDLGKNWSPQDKACIEGS